ncbi:MAG TPA: tetratricopeptide repeat protein [Gemmatimonadaceae bacterium]|nr:tetratricopeptide repeat protein [Gemmatimonadaceae bacterium]
MSQTQPSRWEALTEVARRCVAEKQFDKAEEAFLAALREAEQFGENDPRITATLNALARVYHRRSKFFPAAALLHRLLGIKEREHGEEHPELAGILNNLAEMYSRLGDARQELELRERALHIRTNSGESEGGALDALRMRIAELRQKMDEERSREEMQRNAPKPRIPVPTGATDLPLILPSATPIASPSLGAAAASSPRKAAPASGATPVVEMAVAPVGRRSQTPAPAPAQDEILAITTTPIGSASAALPSVVERAVREESADVDEAQTGAPGQSPARPTGLRRLAPPANDSPWKPIASPAPDSGWKPLAPPAPDSGWKPLAPPAPDSGWKPLAPPAPDSSVKPIGSLAPVAGWKPLASPAPDSLRRPKASPAEPVWTPIAPPAPDASRRPLAAPAPAPAWPSDRDGASDVREADHNDYDAPLEYASPRNWKPVAMGALGVAATVAIAMLVLGGSDDAGASLAGAVEAPPPAQQVTREPARPAPAPPTSGEAAALRAGLANLQQETDPLPPPSYVLDPSGTVRASAAPAEDRRVSDSSERPAPLRVSVPTLALDKVTSSIEAAARARVDSLTQATDKQVVEYTGKKPRQ